MPDAHPTRRPFWIGVWAVFLCGHFVGAILWWGMMPHGFPMTHSRFWVNQVMTIAVAVTATVGLFTLLRTKGTIAEHVVISFVVFWTSAATTAMLLFPDSLFRPRFLLPVGILIVNLWLACIIGLRRPPKRARASIQPLLFAVLSAAAVFAQRAPDPSTFPVNSGVPKMVISSHDQSSGVESQFATNVQFQQADGSIWISHNDVTLAIQPLLTFISRSPDRFWTNFASTSDRESTPRQFLGAISNPTADHPTMEVAYSDEGQQFLQVQTHEKAISITAYCSLEDDVYSHLNSYCDLTISGHHKASLKFSPCPSETVSIEPASYPVGRPMRLAYLNHESTFNIVEANSGEKGPFRVLATGELAKSDPLSITILDDDVPVFRISFDDWASQASTELSPTAGWQLPMNAIEFARSSDDLTSPCHIWMTLAGTSIGRGWDSVGHRAGVYRNRMRIELLDD